MVGPPGRRRPAPGWLAAALLLTEPRGACADVPMEYLRSDSLKANEIAILIWVLLGVSIFVVVVIAILTLTGALRRRYDGAVVAGQMLPVIHDVGGLSWIVIGVGLSTIALFFCMGWNAYTMALTHWPAQEPKLTIEVTGHQWWWQLRYLSDDPSRVFETANEIHLPVGEPVVFKVQTADVIHSFWIPKLGDKIDLIPHQVNYNWLIAGRPGIYRGQCSEYCGNQHAHMAILAVAQEPAEFRAWWDAQLRPTPAATGALQENENDFVLRCGACHTVRGTGAAGRLGPDLTHLMNRHGIAAQTLPNTVAYLSGWIASPQSVKPGNLMPDLDISGPELASIRQFLETLK